MEAAHQPESFSFSEDQAPKQDQPIGWSNIFFGTLIAPATTFGVLANPLIYRPNPANIAGSAIIFCLCALIESFAQAILDRDEPLVVLVSASFISDLFVWLTLAALLALLASLLNRHSNFWSALIVTGWAFVPVIFKSPLVCYYAAFKAFPIVLLGIPLLWFFAFELLAFDSILKLGKVKTLALIFITPPLILIAVIAWLACIATMSLTLH